MEAYFAAPDTLTFGVMLVDARHAPTANDVVMAKYFLQSGKPFVVVANKLDKLKKSEIESNLARIREVLSLPDDWNYTTRGLAKICKEGVDAIGAALRELEGAGYIVRHQRRDKSGRITDTEYVIYEQPQPDMSQPDTASPDTENPDMVKPDTEKPAELNIEKSNTEKSITYGSSTDSIPFHSLNPLPFAHGEAATPPERKRTEAKSNSAVEIYREIIKDNIEYDHLIQNCKIDKDRLDEIVDLMLETVCTARKTIRIAGDDYPAELVKSKFLKLNSSHIEFVLDCMRENTTKVRNIKQYLKAVLFNAPSTIDSYYTALVNHDLYGGE